MKTNFLLSKTALKNFRQLSFILVLILLLHLVFIDNSFAATATPSAKESPSPSASASGSLLAQKINELKEKAASKAADFISQVTKKLQNKAYFGVISSIDGSSIKVVFENKDFTISTNEYTGYSSKIKSSKKITGIKDFAKGDFISALGDTDDKGVLNAKKIIKSTPIGTESSQLVWGVVQKVSGPTITVKMSNNTDQIVTSAVKGLIFLGQEEASLNDIKVGRTIIARGKTSANSGHFSNYIYIIPPSAGAKPEKVVESSKSAVISSASPSSSPKKP